VGLFDIDCEVDSASTVCCGVDGVPPLAAEIGRISSKHVKVTVSSPPTSKGDPTAVAVGKQKGFNTGKFGKGAASRAGSGGGAQTLLGNHTDNNGMDVGDTQLLSGATLTAAAMTDNVVEDMDTVEGERAVYIKMHPKVITWPIQV